MDEIPRKRSPERTQFLHDLLITAVEGGCTSILACDMSNGQQGDYDAVDADCILQLGLLGEVVYG